MDIADKIKFLRTCVLNDSQSRFASKIDVTRNTIKNWESGTSKPSVSHIVRIALICDVTTDYLIYDNHPLELSVIGVEESDYEILKILIDYLTNKS